MSFTPAQQAAIAARGNVLVVAGAGTGKTSTLVERCVDCLVRERASLDQMLIVTFTDAAAAEIRHRIRARLEEQLAAHPEDLHWHEQLALFDAAHIGTLHGFCLKLIRQHFYELELDPQLAVMPEEEARMLADDILEKILQEHYAGEGEANESVRQLIQAHGNSSDLPIRALVLKLHHYTQTLRDPTTWLDAQLSLFNSPQPTLWREWLATAITDWHARWFPTLQSLAAENPKATECAKAIEKLSAHSPLAELAEAFAAIQASDNGEWPPRKKTALREPLGDFFDEALFLGSLLPSASTLDPLLEDWNWARGQMATLLNLTREFGEAFANTKREQGSVDFHDLEQHSLRLLWDRPKQTPSAIALQWRRQLRFVFVDEYQDINEAQDAILTALSGEGETANRFLVGDVKQSIYRFRLAAPHIFQNYARAWSDGASQVIPLSQNFRSREAILGFVNALFSELMRPDIGGVAYDENARLQFGAPDQRAHLSLAHHATSRVELHLRLKSGPEVPDTDEDSADAVHLEESAHEARLAALRLLELKNTGHLIWDEYTEAMRHVQWPDMAILLRSPSGKSETFTREFARLGIPLTVARSGFYDSMEIADLISLLQLLDNPLQDVPALAVLHSPLVGMSPDDLAAIRLTAPKERFWTALQRFHESQTNHSAWPRADRFLKNFSRWRRLSRQISLSRCLETVLTETHYAAWLFTQSRGPQRHANVQRLLALARQFDQFQRQGLFRFLHFVDAQKAAETEPPVAPISGGDSVTLMSIHQSKGLEFPVVVLADLGKQFNFSDLKAEIILDEKYGLCPRIKPPHTGRRYPSLPYWLARRRQKQETLGEELRLLYVAMTRARDTLILTGNLTRKKFENHWLKGTGVTLPAQLDARNYLDWLAAWTSHSAETTLSDGPGGNALFYWKIYEAGDTAVTQPSARPASPAQSAEKLDAHSWRELQQRLTAKYPFAAATEEPAKTSVTMVRRQLAEETDDGVKPLFRFQFKNRAPAPSRKLSATDIGLAHHTFLQNVSLERTGSLDDLKHEAARLAHEKFLTAEETAHLDLPALADFWMSPLGKSIRAQSSHVHRELAFTARMAPRELVAVPPVKPMPFDEDFVVVQGAADLVVLLPEEIRLVDFKTDHFVETHLDDKVKLYAPQLRLYAAALERIYQRPVTEMHLHFLALRRSVPIVRE